MAGIGAHPSSPIQSGKYVARSRAEVPDVDHEGKSSSRGVPSPC